MAKDSKKAEGVGRELSPEEMAEYNRYRALGRTPPDKFDNVVVENVNNNFVMRYATNDEQKAAEERHEKMLKAAQADEDALNEIREEVGGQRYPMGPAAMFGGGNGPGTQPGRGAETPVTTS
jgi:hypothetical protein